MNRVILCGRLTKDPTVSQNGEMITAKYSLAVDRVGAKDGGQTADFINCVAFGKNGEFASKYLHKGTKILIEGHIVTGSYTNKDNQKVYTTEVAIDKHEFVESKGANQTASAPADLPISQPSFATPQFAMPTPTPMPSSEPTQITMGFVNVPPTEGEEFPFGSVTR